MKCEWVKENILLYVYDEVADDTRYELEQHVARCTNCAAELESVRLFRTSVSQPVVAEPSPNLLASSRMKLQEALETTEQNRFWRRFIIDPTAWLQQMRFSPALAAMLLIVGFAGGIGATYKISSDNRANLSNSPVVTSQSPSESSISGIRSITQQPGSKQVSIQYDTVSTQQTQGSLNDERIQQLLLYAARNNYNSGVRMDSVDLLTQQPSDPHVREALIYALRYDSNPGVRLKALDGLGPFVKDDLRVRDAVLEGLMSDSNPGVRTEALRLVEPVRADSSVRIVLQKLAAGDHNQYIRSQARTLLAQMPEID
ncbi:MAG TPA: HEAT repeat domain-containing protein [Terriglobales bacterium]|nr:HEAT repeat domain-containing protein [Terriglobales bacterium]